MITMNSIIKTQQKTQLSYLMAKIKVAILSTLVLSQSHFLFCTRRREEMVFAAFQKRSAGHVYAADLGAALM